MLMGLYLWTLPWDQGLAGVVHPLSLGLMAAGYGLATWATVVLGVDRTWFGVELGQLAPKRIARFPYGLVPHPMIVGGIVGLLGFHASPGLRELVPWLVPVHIAFYVVHMLQEMTDTAHRANRTETPAAS